MKNFKSNYSKVDFNFTEIVKKDFKNRGRIYKNYIHQDSYNYPVQESIYNFDMNFKKHVKKNSSVKEYVGPHYSNRIIIDVDGPKVENINDVNRIELAKFETLKIVGELYNLDIMDDQINIFFSGGKGFHIELPRDLIKNCTPSKSFNEIDKIFIGNLFNEILSVDTSIYKITGLIRVPNSVHQKTHLYKIPLSLDELKNSTADEIVNLAKKPKILSNNINNENIIIPNEALTKIYNSSRIQLIMNQQKIFKAVYSNENEVVKNDKYYSDEELLEVCEFISKQKTLYDDWISCLFACASLGEKGRKYFKKLSDNHFFPEDSPECFDKLFNYGLNNYDSGMKNRCTAGSLFRVAKNYGHKFQKDFSLTDEGNRERFIHINGNHIRYNYEKGKWYYYNGHYWIEDDNGILNKCIDTVTNNMKREVENSIFTENTKEIRSHLKRTRSRTGRNAIADLAKNDGRIIMKNSDFDSKPNFFNCKNGTIELLTKGDFHFREHNRSDYLTKSSPVIYNREVKAHYWFEFLDVIFNCDKDLIKYFQKALGYSITGNTDENVLFFLVGDGANGKSTMLEILKILLGDYCKKSKVNILLKNGGEATGMDIARLTGARVVICTETDLGTSFDEAKIKDLTGGDTLVARQLFKDYFEFKPEFKIWMYGNNKPQIKGNDFGIKRRIKVIPFTVRIPVDKRAPQSKIIEQMKSEFSGILNWILEGYQLYKFEGLGMPDSVKNATEDYFENLDYVGKFLDEKCIQSPTLEIKVQMLYEAFKDYMTEIGEHPWTRLAFNEDLIKRKFKKKVIGSRGTQWFGIALKENNEYKQYTIAPPKKTTDNDNLKFPSSENEL